MIQPFICPGSVCINESDVPTDRMVFILCFPAEGKKNVGCCGAVPPPPRLPLAFERAITGIREDTDIGWIMTYFQKSSPYGFEIKSCHRRADSYFA